MKPMEDAGVTPDNIIGFTLDYGSNGKAPVKVIKEYLNELLPELEALGVETLFVCDGPYFKTLTKSRTVEPHHGYVLPCAIKDFEHMNVVVAPNYAGLFHNPDLGPKIELGVKTLTDHMKGSYQALGADIIHSAAYPDTEADIEAWFAKLHQYDALTCDIEAFSLRFWEAGIGSLAFAWDQHNGVSFAVDYSDDVYQLKKLINLISPDEEVPDYKGCQVNNIAVKLMFRKFLEEYEGRIIWHNAGYDAKVVIYELWMDHPLDQEGLLKGLEVMTKRFHDTQIITYLATNSTAGNKLGLKTQAHEFAGNWAEDNVNDIRLIAKADLLQYNLVDCLSTWYVFNKHYPTMVADQQLGVYDTIFIPSVKVILQMELTGIPLVPEEVAKSRAELEDIRDGHTRALFAEPIIQEFEQDLRIHQMDEDNKVLKTKKRQMHELLHIVFNPGSTKQLQDLLYGKMGYDVVDRTNTKLPATGAKTIKKLKAVSKSDRDTRIFDALIGLAEVNIILNNFISAFETKGFMKSDGRYYLHGSFKLGGTVSGRLSSSGPNLMNMPSEGTKYAKYTKRCFIAPPGWVIMGADFASLEDRISALTTKDPNKLKVYTDGYDGHCLRAHFYYGDKMPDIIDTVDSINSIKGKYKAYRQQSKTPTFLLTYGGTYHGLMANEGMSEIEAKRIEAAYHEMYTVSDQWVESKIKQACKDGYVTVAFGLRVRTPILAKTVLGTKRTPYEAQAEGRTAGNALGQSYGMLNNRAGIEFQERTLASPYRLDIKPFAHIHDAQYMLVRDDADVVEWVNTNLVECMEWQDLPEIQHPDVPLGGELDLFYPSWANSVTIPNGMSAEDIQSHCSKAIDEYYEDLVA